MSHSISRRQFVLGSMALPAIAAPKAVQPNVVLMVVDYLPAWALGCYGSKEVRTPHIDRLALTGARFTSHYASASTAAQGRATLLSGRTTAQLRDAVSAPAGSSLSAILAKAGYDCKTVANEAPDAVASEGAKVIEAQTPGKPFLLETSFTGMVPPYDGTPERFRRMYAGTVFETLLPAPPVSPAARRNREMLQRLLVSFRDAAATVTAVDEAVGAVAAAVDRKGLMDSTLIIVTASCGALWSQHGLWGAGDCSDPVNMYQECLVTPMIWRWPLRVPPNTRRPELVGGYSFVPSVLDLLAIGDKTNYCGRSYSPLALGQAMSSKQPWRNVVHSQTGSAHMVRDSHYKLVLRDGGKGPGELYDLQTDAREAINLYESASFVTMRKALSAEIEKFNQSCPA
jgi:arylsulfatase A-like enzyme